MKKQLKLAIFALTVFIAGVANAQQTSGEITRTDKGNETGTNKTVRVIDNKGTIKYLQAKNGITTLTNTTGNRTVTTWQLGGELDNDTYINANGQTFSLDGLKLATPADAIAATATSQSVGTNAATINGSLTATTDTGLTVLVRDERTGEIKKMLFTDLLEVQSVQLAFEVDSDSTLDATGATSTTVADLTTTGLTLDFSTELSKVNVFRNGAKLIAGRDYSITGGTNLKLIPNTTTTSIHYWALNEEDFIEIHYTK